MLAALSIPWRASRWEVLSVHRMSLFFMETIDEPRCSAQNAACSTAEKESYSTLLYYTVYDMADDMDRREKIYICIYFMKA